MPCKNPSCGQSVDHPKHHGCRVRYCVCGYCNHCHFNYICPDGGHWYLKQQSHKHLDDRMKFTPGQSHGGNAVPDCVNNVAHILGHNIFALWLE